jgi:hypothetical protein
MPTKEQEILDYVNRLSDEEFHLLRGAVTAREQQLKPSALRRLALEERRRILEAYAEDAAKSYDPNEWNQWQGGDIIEND